MSWETSFNALQYCAEQIKTLYFLYSIQTHCTFQTWLKLIANTIEFNQKQTVWTRYCLQCRGLTLCNFISLIFSGQGLFLSYSTISHTYNVQLENPTPALKQYVHISCSHWNSSNVYFYLLYGFPTSEHTVSFQNHAVLFWQNDIFVYIKNNGFFTWFCKNIEDTNHNYNSSFINILANIYMGKDYQQHTFLYN